VIKKIIERSMFLIFKEAAFKIIQIIDFFALGLDHYLIGYFSL
jgi:hypothetical protein